MWEKVKELEALHTGVNGTITFTGTGTDDLSVSGSAWFASSRNYVIEIDGTETFKWSNDGGTTWERELQPITSGAFVQLVNASGEVEGISIRFASRVGHVIGDNWAFATTGQVVPDTATLLGSGQVNQGSEAIVLKGEYVKGTEDGLRIYLELPVSKNGSVAYRPSRPVAAGGVLVHYPEIFEITSSGSFTYMYETNGASHYRVYAVKKSGVVSGTFTLLHEQNRSR